MEKAQGPLLEVAGLSKSYPPPSGQVLFDISFRLYPRDIVALIGPSGAGKTTLANILGGLDSNYWGSAKVDGKELKDYKPYLYRRHKVGVIFQRYYLIPVLNVYENVDIVLKIMGIPKSKRSSKVKEVLQAVEMWKHKDKYPNQLSGGQSQRVAVARALVKHPKVVLADEPTGNLDTKTGTKVINLINNLTNKINGVAIIITHDLEFIYVMAK